MRKLIVLIITSVLATGAVANADTVNVTENPADYISIVGIVKNDGTALGTGKIIIPSLATSKGNVNTSNWYKARVEVLNTNLEQVVVCLFDSNVVTDPATCGIGVNDYAGLSLRPTAASAWNGTSGHESSIVMSFLAKMYDAATIPADDQAAFGTGRPSSNYHWVARENGAGEKSESVLTTLDGFGGAEQASGPVSAMEFAFSPRIMAKSDNDWKLRVYASYSDGTAVALVDDTLYEIDSVSGFESGTLRGDSSTVSYGDVISGESVTQSEIPTGNYFANFSPSITLEADRFKGTIGSTPVTLGLKGDANPGSGEVSLACDPGTADPTSFFDAIASSATGDPKSSKTLLTGLSAQSDTGQVGANAVVSSIEAQKHSCKFKAGSDLDVGTYTNSVTVGIG